MCQQAVEFGIEQVFLQQDGKVGAQGGKQVGDKSLVDKEITHIQAMPAEKLFLEQRQVAHHGVAVFAEGDKGGVTGGERCFDPVQGLTIPILIDTQSMQNFIDRQMREQMFGDHAHLFGFRKALLRETLQGTEQAGGQAD